MTVTDDRPLRIPCVIITRLWLFRSGLFGQAIRSYLSCQRASRTRRRSRRSPRSGTAYGARVIPGRATRPPLFSANGHSSGPVTCL